MGRGWFVTVAALALAAGCSGGQATPPAINTGRPALGTISEFRLPAGHFARAITGGGDGYVWFTESTIVGRMSTSGALEEFPAAASGRFASGIVTASDGTVWFGEYGSSDGCLDHFTGGTVTRSCDHALVGVGSGPTLGPDGNFWFTNVVLNSLVRVTPSGVFTRFWDGFPIDSIPGGLAAGPDGNVWYSGSPDLRIGRITPSGSVLPSFPALSSYAMTAGPDGNMWVTDATAAITRVTPGGSATQFTAGINPNAEAAGIASGPDGNLWFAEWSADRIARITPSGVVTEFASGITPGAHPDAITVGPDGNIWFTEDNGGIGRLIVK